MVVNDVIVIGGSFAGLSTSYSIDTGKILLLEKEEELGKKQRSACATFVEWLKRFKCEESVLKTFDSMTLHSSSGYETKIKLFEPVCTFDYGVFCKSLSRRIKNAEVITGSKVKGISNGRRKTIFCEGDEKYTGRIVVDASGWRAIAAGSLKPDYSDSSKLAFGIEVEADYSGNPDSLHFFFGKRFIKGGYGWVFPVSKKKARVGVGSFYKFNAKEVLARFMSSIELEMDDSELRGGFIPCFGLREPVIEDLFIVGDACGQVLPVSAEGIRKSLYYGEVCGRLISGVLKNELDLEEALDRYKTDVNKSRRFYENLYFIQKMAVHAPDKAWDMFIKKLSMNEDIGRRLLSSYMADAITASKLALLKGLLRIMLA